MTSLLKHNGINIDHLSDEHKKVVKAIDKKWVNHFNTIEKDEWTIVGYDELLDLLDTDERKFVEDLYSIDPSIFGFKGPFYGTETPFKLIKVESYTFKSGRESGVQHCPDNAYYDYLDMNKAMVEEIGKGVIIDSGYRSAGRQAFVFMRTLANYSNYSVVKTANSIAFPGYSEHGAAENVAIDFSTETGINGFSDDQVAEDFEKTEEYEWLSKNATKYNFHLSYPKNNALGITFEPWHWHWEFNEEN